MSVSLEHDYIGLSEPPPPSMEGSERKSGGLNLKATELRLGLPGSESPERDNGYPLGVVKSMLGVSSGAKRGFSDAIDGSSGKWVFSGSGGSEAELGKGGNLFSPRGSNSVGKGGLGSGSEVNNQNTGVGGPVLKDGNAVGPQSPKPLQEKKPQLSAPAAKAQVVGWPPIRSFRKNSMASHPPKSDDDADGKLGWPPIRSFRKNSMASHPTKSDDDAEGKLGSGCLYVKVSMDGAPYLRKIDLKTYGSYMELSSALEKMFSCFTIGQCGSHGVPSRDGLSESRLMDLLHGSEYVLTYEDKDGDWMLVGDVPWEMFTDSCKRMRIMKSSDAIGLAPRAMEKCKNRN